MVEFTSRFRFPVPDFLEEPWHATLQAALRSIDTAISQALLAVGTADWANSTAYTAGTVVIDSTDGTFWICGVAHTSPASPVTFATFRAANPTYWNSTATIPRQRGAWLTDTSYIAGDFVVDSSRYAVCIVAHVSTSFNTDLAAAKWVVLIDLSTLGVGINEQAEGTLASAATCNIGGETETRINVTGAIGVTSFGTIANKFKIVRYASTPTVTHDVTKIILLGAANYTARAGDLQMLASDATGIWRELFRSRADGNPATTTERGVVELATDAETITGNDTVRATTPKSVKAAMDAGASIPSGSVILFLQATVPTGYVLLTTHNDRALRIVSGSGGGGGGLFDFSTIFAKTVTDDHTLALAEMWPHNHGGATGTDTPEHVHDDGTAYDAKATTTINNPFSGGTPTVVVTNVDNSGGGNTGNPLSLHAHGISTEGGAQAHSHAFDVRVKYSDVIPGTRS